MISFDEWAKAELKAAKIISAEDIPGKDRLYKLQIDLGTEKRQIIAGVKQSYSKEELEGKTIIAVTNLAPAKIAGLESQAMLLAVKNSAGAYSLVSVDTAEKVAAGTLVE